MLFPGSYAVRWHDVSSRRTIDAESVTADDTAPVTFRSPFHPPVLRYCTCPQQFGKSPPTGGRRSGE